jgi:hypothetical protein
MTIEEFNEEFRALIPLPPRRYRDARVLLARQLAMSEAGPRHRAYFRKYRARLIADAAEEIANNPRYYRWRKPQLIGFG